MLFRTSRHISPLIALIVTLAALLTPTAAVKCLDCVGKNCMGDFCEGDYCVLSHYAPRWGTVEWGQPQVVKGCMSGTMLRKDVRSHCETADGNGDVSSSRLCWTTFRVLVFRTYSHAFVTTRIIAMATRRSTVWRSSLYSSSLVPATDLIAPVKRALVNCAVLWSTIGQNKPSRYACRRC